MSHAQQSQQAQKQRQPIFFNAQMGPASGWHKPSSGHRNSLNAGQEPDKVKTNAAEDTIFTDSVVVTTDGDQNGAALAAVPTYDPDSEAPPSRGLSRQESMKNAANKAADHYKDHKWKYIVCKVIVGLAIGLGVGLGIAVALKSKSGTMSSLQARLAANAGVTIKPVTIIPAKGSKSSRRMLASFLRRVLAATAVDPATFPDTSDYNVAGSPNYVVGDDSAQATKTINMIACSVTQLRVADVGLNTTENPKLLPYVALVNDKLCGNQPAMSTWFVKSKGPAVFGSDGLYVTNGQIKKEGIYIQIENTIVGGAVSTSKIYFQSGDGLYMKGTLQMDFSNPSKTDVIFSIMNSYNGNIQNQYLHATFDPLTFVGSAVSNAIADSWDNINNKVVFVETKYSLDFNQNGINRRQQIDSSAATSTCIDFSVASRILVGDRYTLYSALDGSALNFQSGFSVTHTFAQYVQPVYAYASFWGVYSDYGVKSDGNSEDTSALWVDGLSVDKLNYDGSTSQLTLKLVKARLQKISRRTVTLDTIKGLPLYVDSYNGGDSFAISWDGSKLNVVARTSKGCWDYSAQDYVSLASGVSIIKYSDCQCLVSAGNSQYTVSTSASVSLSSGSFSFTDKGEASVTSTPLAITTAIFPRGIRVRSKDYTLSGQIEIEYDSIQTLYGVMNQGYVAGGTIKQSSTGATGTVYKSTKNKFFGLASSPSISCASPLQTNCALPSSLSTEQLVRQGAMVNQEQFGIMSTIAQNSKTMGGSQTVWTAVSSSSFAGIKVGMMVTGTGIPDYTYVSAIDTTAYTITLSNAATTASISSAPETFTFSVVAIVRDYWWGYGGLSFDYFTPNNAAAFDISSTAAALKVAMPPTDQRSSPFDYFTGYSGTLTWDTNTGLSTDWNSYPTITTASYSGCSDNGATLSATVTGVTGATLSLWSYSGTLSYVYISAPGSSCINPVVSFSCSGGTGTFVPPVVTGLTCNRHIAAVSNSVMVLLSSPTATKFTTYYSPDGSSSTADHTVTYTPPGSTSATSVGSPYWSNAQSGDARLPSGSSLLIYQTQSVVMPGETVPELLCSSGSASCPQGAAANYYPVFTASITSGSKTITITTASTTGVALTGTSWDGMYVQGTGIDPDYAAQKGYNKIVSCSSSTECLLDSAATATSTGVTITGSNSAGSLSSTNYGSPSHLNPSVTMVKPGTCRLISGTAPPQGTATYANIGGSPVIKLDWDSGTVKSDGTYYSVSFMRLTDRGMVCSDSNTPTVTWTFDTAVLDCGSNLPTATLSCDSSSGSDISDYRQAYRYTFDSTTGALTDVTSTTGGIFVLDKNNWNMATSTNSARFGPFFANTAANKELLKCDYDSSLACGYKVYEELDTFYQYMTGTSSDSQRVSMVDAAGKTILFDQPMPLTYRHSGTTSNSRTKSYDGVLMMLKYNGPGELQGFPQVCVDSNMEVTQCVMNGNSKTTNYPDITLPENVPITDLNGDQYYARAEEVSERYPKAADPTICSALTFGSLPSVPDLTKLFVAPSNADAPAPTDSELAANYLNAGKPEVIGGVTLYELKAIAAATANKN